jgi:hypothetical protein
MGITSVLGSVVPKLDAGAWEIVGLNLEIIDSIVNSVARRLSGVCQTFGIQTKE